jgi:hypothetical protein
MCIVVTLVNRVVVFQYYGNEINFSPYTLFWIWFTMILDLLVLLILYALLFHVGRKYPQCHRHGIVVGLVFAAFIILVSSCNILMLRTTGMFSFNTLDFLRFDPIRSNDHSMKNN